MKDKVLIFLNGSFPGADFAKSLIDKQTYLIGADGGADFIYDLGLKPDAVVGDLDSVKNIPNQLKKLKAPDPKAGHTQTVDSITYVKFPVERDFTDGEAALDFALQQGFSKINIVCALGRDLDHEIGNLFMIGKSKYAGLDIKILESNVEIFIASGKVEISGEVGQKISLMPIFGKVEVSESSGLKYDPSKYQMAMEFNAGSRNEFSANTVKLKITTGKFLAVIYKK